MELRTSVVWPLLLGVDEADDAVADDGSVDLLIALDVVDDRVVVPFDEVGLIVATADDAVESADVGRPPVDNIAGVEWGFGQFLGREPLIEENGACIEKRLH